MYPIWRTRFVKSAVEENHVTISNTSNVLFHKKQTNWTNLFLRAASGMFWNLFWESLILKNPSLNTLEFALTEKWRQQNRVITRKDGTWETLTTRLRCFCRGRQNMKEYFTRREDEVSELLPRNTARTVPCKQRLHFHCMMWRAKSSLCRQPFKSVQNSGRTN